MIMNKRIQTAAVAAVVMVATTTCTVVKTDAQQLLEFKGMLSPEDLPEGSWMSLEDGSQVLMLQDHDEATLDADTAERLAKARRRFLSNSSSSYENQFIDGSETYYNDYAQAWRLLGFYTDCNAPHNNYNQCRQNGGNKNNNNNNNKNQNKNNNDNAQAACQRYLLWAAYIDLDYSGGKIGEYQFYDRKEQRWDDTSCVANNGRCAKMDCHLKSTHFKLLGFFKEPNYHEWMEQLFKHQGVCLWTDEEYYFMDTDRILWPCDCTATKITDENGNTLYYDAKPMVEGRLGLGLYTDQRCRYDYTGSMDTVEVLKQVGGDISSLAQSLSTWNDAFDVYKVCQPCKAYNLGYNADLNQGQGDRKGGDEENGGEAFDCYDDANYVNVNQCMKFKTKTEMIAADFRDLMLAHEQGNIVQFEVMGYTYGYGGYRTATGVLATKLDMSGKARYPSKDLVFFLASTLFVAMSIVMYIYYRGRESMLLRRWRIPLVSSSSFKSTAS